MKRVWQFINPGGRLKRRPYVFTALGISLFGVAGSYLSSRLLVTDDYVSPIYLEIAFAWSLLLLAAFTPFAMQRSRDIGISTWWVLLLWIPPFFDFKFLAILSKHWDVSFSGLVLMSGFFAALCSATLILALFFSKSQADESTPNQA